MSGQHQRLKTETDHIQSSQQQPILAPKPKQNNFFAEVVQASQGGLGHYQSVPKQAVNQPPRKSSSNVTQAPVQQQQVSYDAYNKLMQQFIKEAQKPAKQSSDRKGSNSSRTRTKSQQTAADKSSSASVIQQQKVVQPQMQYFQQKASQDLPRQNTVQVTSYSNSQKPRDGSSFSGSSQQNNAIL